MRSKVVRTLALALLLCSAVMSTAQQPAGPQGGVGPGTSRPPKQKAAPEKSKLEEMLSEALKNNPDIRVAAAKLAEAEAELNRTRVQVTQQVVNLHQAILSHKAMVDFTQKKFDRMNGLLADRAIDSTLVDEELAKLTAAKAKLAELEAQIPGLLGKSPLAEYSLSIPFTLLRRETSLQSLVTPRVRIEGEEREQAHKATGPMAERLRKALQTPVKVDYKVMSLNAILDDLSKKVPGLSFRNLVEGGGPQKMDLRFEEALPVSAILQALADERGCIFYVREYGILATNYTGPAGAMTVEQFLHQKPADEPRHPSGGGKNPPAENVEGLVKSVDASGLLTISIGSDAGLTKGHTLELFRLNPSAPSQSKYLGSVRILEVQAHQSVAQPVGRLAAPPQRGDRVSSRIMGK